MKKLITIVLASLVVFVACNKEESTGTEIADLNFLSLGVDGDTDVLVNKLKDAVLADGQISDDEAEGLRFMREEEKLAADLYASFFDNYELRIFGNIAKSEQTHMAAILLLIDAFELVDPASDEAGKFSNEDLQKAFDELSSAGNVSLVEALKVGAYVEELDILDLEEQLEIVTNEDIRLVYENLLRGSRNHLRAFVKVLARNDVTYQPTLLSDDYYSEVINSEMERGGAGNCALGYRYANRNKGQGRLGYNAENAACDGSGTASEQQGDGNKYRGGKNGN